MFVYTLQDVIAIAFVTLATAFWLAVYLYVKFKSLIDAEQRPTRTNTFAPLLLDQNEPDLDEVEREFREYNKPKPKHVCTICGSDTTEEQSTPDKSGYSVPLYWCDHCDRYVETVGE